MLAKLVAPMDAERGAAGMAAMLPMLAHYPDAMFTPASAAAVASTGRVFDIGKYGPLTRIPTFGELDTALGRWWRQERERVALRAEPEPRLALAGPPAPAAAERPLAAVRDVVQAFVAERAALHVEEAPARRKVTPRPLSDGQLLVLYEEGARSGDALAAARLVGLRRRIAVS